MKTLKEIQDNYLAIDFFYLCLVIKIVIIVQVIL